MKGSAKKIISILLLLAINLMMLVCAFTTETNAVSDEKTNEIVIVMDVSNSMNSKLQDSTTRYDAVMKAVENFVLKIAEAGSTKNKIGFVAYNTDAHKIFDLQSCDDYFFASALVNFIKSTTESIINYPTESHARFTNIEAGLKMAYDMLSPSKNTNQYVIFVNDGFPTTYVSSEYNGYDPYTASGTKGEDGIFYDYVTDYYCEYGTSYSDKAAIRARKMADKIKELGVKIFPVGVDLSEQTIDSYDRLTGISVIDRTGTAYEIGAGNDSNSYKNWLKNKVGSGSYYDCNSTDDIANAFESALSNIKLVVAVFFPKSYNYNEDSYSFGNYSTTFGLSKKYFTTIYEEAPGKQLHKKNKNVSNNGLCFGMVYTTASIYNGLPATTSIIDENIFADDQSRNIIKDIKKSDKLYINDFKISIDDYIKYAFVYQWAQESITDVNIDSYIDNTIERDALSTVLALYRNDDTGHAVLLTGYKVKSDGSVVYYVDDPNSVNGLETILLSTDGSWEFSNPWDGTVDSTNSVLGAYVDVHAPYRILLTGDRATVKENIDLNATETTETYIENMERVNADKTLLYVNSDQCTIECEDMYEVGNIDLTGTNENAEETGRFYWINNGNSAVLSEFTSDDNEVSLSGDNTIITANVTKDSAVAMTIDKDDISAEIVTEEGKKYTLSFETIITDAEYNNVETNVTVNGTATGEEITATQTETGLAVTGIEDGTITLTKDDEVIATQTVTDAESDIEITYDKNGESDNLDVDYEAHEHKYNSEVTKEATCTENGVKTFTCSCNDSYTEIIPAKRHSLGEWKQTKAPTCTEKGEETKYCANCNYTENKSVNATGHFLGEWKQTKAPTCTEKGEEKRNCANCSYSETKSVNAKGHDFNGAICKNCGADKTKDCSCNCHKSGFMGFIWKIINFFNKLFKSNPVCDCGVRHY